MHADFTTIDVAGDPGALGPREEDTLHGAVAVWK